MDGSVLYEITGLEPGDGTGAAVDGLGDINGDGYDDFAIASALADYSSDEYGRADVYSGFDGSLMYTFNGYHTFSLYGRDICGTVDVDHDGVRDLLVGGFQGEGAAGPFAGEVIAYQLGDADGDGVLVGCDVCPIADAGDVNTDGVVTSADIIYLVGYVFKGGPAPKPCDAAGDVNCTGSVTSADIIYLVSYVFKGGPPPCDVCGLIPVTWSCP